MITVVIALILLFHLCIYFYFSGIQTYVTCFNTFLKYCWRALNLRFHLLLGRNSSIILSCFYIFKWYKELPSTSAPRQFSLCPKCFTSSSGSIFLIIQNKCKPLLPFFYMLNIGHYWSILHRTGTHPGTFCLCFASVDKVIWSRNTNHKGGK